MELFASKFVTISSKKILGRNCSELHLVGTNLQYNFLSNEENMQMDSRYSMLIKDIKNELDCVKKISKTLIIKNGEPFLQSTALRNIAKHAKDNNMLVSVETYGTKPGALRQAINENLIDILTLKIYSPLTDSWFKRMNRSNLLTNYSELIANIKESIKILSATKIKVNIRTIIVPSLIYKKNDIHSICKQISKINNCTYEICEFQTSEAGKLFANIKAPGKEFMEELKKDVQSKFHSLHVK
jgi:pyruvate-formate lyase-activating enzyme